MVYDAGYRSSIGNNLGVNYSIYPRAKLVRQRARRGDDECLKYL